MRAMLTTVLILSVPACGAVWAQEVVNPSFEEGTRTPTGWRASDGSCTWETTGHTGSRCVSVEGTAPEQQASWTQEGVALTPGGTYRFSCWARSEAGAAGGCIVSGRGRGGRAGGARAGDPFVHHELTWVTAV